MPSYLLYFFEGLVHVLLGALQIALFLRAVFSWLPVEDDHPFLVLLYGITEPIVAPIRLLFDRLGWFQGTPLDMAFFAAVLIVSLLNLLL